MRERELAQLKEQLYERVIVELIREILKEISKLFGVLKDGGEKQILILDTRRANCHFIELEHLELSHPGPFIQPWKAETNLICGEAGH